VKSGSPLSSSEVLVTITADSLGPIVFPQ
jgi:hypothetical protein